MLDWNTAKLNLIIMGLIISYLQIINQKCEIKQCTMCVPKIG